MMPAELGGLRSPEYEKGEVKERRKGEKEGEEKGGREREGGVDVEMGGEGTSSAVGKNPFLMEVAGGEFPEMDGLGRMARRLREMDEEKAPAGGGGGGGRVQRDELMGMVRRWMVASCRKLTRLVQIKSLLHPAMEQLPYLHEQIAAQRETIGTMQQQAKLSEQLATVER